MMIPVNAFQSPALTLMIHKGLQRTRTTDLLTSFNPKHCIENTYIPSSSAIFESAVSSQSQNDRTATSFTLDNIKKITDKATQLFPFWVVLFSMVGWKCPNLTGFKLFLPYITPSLAFTMFTMGITLTFEDFRNVIANWRYVLIGFIAQYSIMPALAKIISVLFRLPPELSIGLILVGCSPGGTASNLVSMIAQADVALSVMMTTASTIAAVFMTPLLISTIIGSSVKVSVFNLIQSVVNVVLVPVLAGLVINTKFPKSCRNISQITPFISVLCVAMICGTVSAASSVGITINKAILLRTIGAVFTLHSFGFALGYAFARLAKTDENSARTISIETGMQNSALATVLAQHFPSPQLSALPGVISATCHSVLGSLLAAFWRSKASLKKLN